MLFTFSIVAIYGGQPQRGVRMLAAAESLVRERGLKIDLWGGPILMVYKQAKDRAQSQLVPKTLEATL